MFKKISLLSLVAILSLSCSDSNSSDNPANPKEESEYIGEFYNVYWKARNSQGGFDEHFRDYCEGGFQIFESDGSYHYGRYIENCEKEFFEHDGVPNTWKFLGQDEYGNDIIEINLEPTNDNRIPIKTYVKKAGDVYIFADTPQGYVASFGGIFGHFEKL